MRQWRGARQSAIGSLNHGLPGLKDFTGMISLAVALNGPVLGAPTGGVRASPSCVGRTARRGCGILSICTGSGSRIPNTHNLSRADQSPTVPQKRLNAEDVPYPSVDVCPVRCSAGHGRHSVVNWPGRLSVYDCGWRLIREIGVIPLISDSDRVRRLGQNRPCGAAGSRGIILRAQVFGAELFAGCSSVVECSSGGRVVASSSLVTPI